MKSSDVIEFVMLNERQNRIWFNYLWIVNYVIIALTL